MGNKRLLRIIGIRVMINQQARLYLLTSIV